MTHSPDLGEKALSKVAEIGITSQLDEVENINVDIRANPSQIIQGEVDSVAIAGQGLVIKQDLRMEILEVSFDKVAINPLSAVFGNIELTHPTEAEAHIVLTEADLNRAFNADYLHAKLQNLKMNIEGETVMVDIQQASVHLPGDNKLMITADFLLHAQGETKTLSATAIPQIEQNGHQLSLEILSTEGQGVTPEVVASIFEQLTAVLDLRNFNLPGMSLQLKQLEAQKNQLVIQATTQIDQFPSA